jgi:hypothetical protein
LAFAADNDLACQLISHLFSTTNSKAAKVKRIALVGDEDAHAIDWMERVGFVPDDVIQRPCTAELLFRSMDRFFDVATDQESTDSHQLAAAVISDETSPVPASSLSTICPGVES